MHCVSFERIADISLQFPIIIIISAKIKVEPLFVIDQHVQEVLDRNTIQAKIEVNIYEKATIY